MESKFDQYSMERESPLTDPADIELLGIRILNCMVDRHRIKRQLKELDEAGG